VPVHNIRGLPQNKSFGVSRTNRKSKASLLSTRHAEDVGGTRAFRPMRAGPEEAAGRCVDSVRWVSAWRLHCARDCAHPEPVQTRRCEEVWRIPMALFPCRSGRKWNKVIAKKSICISSFSFPSEWESFSASTPNSYLGWLLSRSGTPGQPARLGRGDTLHVIMCEIMRVTHFLPLSLCQRTWVCVCVRVCVCVCVCGGGGGAGGTVPGYHLRYPSRIPSQEIRLERNSWIMSLILFPK